MKKKVHQTKILATVTPATPRMRGGWPADVPRHSRILSAWHDDILRLDGSPARNEYAIDLSMIPLPGNDDVGGPLAPGQTLAQFPHWMDVAKAYAALTLQEIGGYDPLVVVANGLNHLFRLFAWCVRRRTYHLSSLELEDLASLANELRPEGWFSALGFHERLNNVIDRVQKDRDFGMSLVNLGHGNLAISPARLSDAIGIVISTREYPSYLRPKFARALSLKCRTRQSERDQRWSESSFKTCYIALNRLVRLPVSLDRLNFEPFANSRRHARNSGGKPDQRTVNIPVEELAKILRTALTWVYDRSEGVLALVATCCEAARTAGQRTQSRDEIAKHMQLELQAAYPAIRERYGLPEATLPCSVRGRGSRGVSVVDLVHRLETSVALLVGINLARRKNEILGEDARPYGLYRGCLTLADRYVDAYELDVYIEKTWQDWRAMSTNKLIVDSVRALERLREIMFPDEVMDEPQAKEDRRARKLFIVPSTGFLLGTNDSPSRYAFETHSVSFFQEAGVAAKYRRTHTMRRFFAMAFMYRWDHPALQALSEHLCHLGLEVTRVYVTNDSMRVEVERTAKMLRIRADGLPIEELAEAQVQYRDDQLRAMLTSTAAGGPMTYRVRKWVRRLAPKVQFLTPKLDAMVEVARSTMDKKKYLPISFRHGVCWAPELGTAPRVARCGDGSRLHREKAGIRVCRKCPFHSTSDGFLKNVEADARSLEMRANDSHDQEERRCCEASAKSLWELIASERALMAQQHAPYGDEGRS